jgi:3-hydroxyacyl-[acyl-carrier-protein] dehydratase
MNAEEGMDGGSAGGAMDILAIMRILPHRYPLLYVDRVTECVPGKHIRGLKNVTRGEPFLARAGRPRAPSGMPHLLVVEALAQIAVILTYRTLAREPVGNDLLFFAGIDTAHFGVPVGCGDTLVLHAEIARLRKSAGWFAGRAEVDGRVACEVRMMAAWQVG